MFLENVKIIQTSPCYANKERIKVIAATLVDLTEILPYLNAILEKPNYQIASQSLEFKQGIVGITLQEYRISMSRVKNITEAHEILDWLIDLINDIYESRDEITPNFKGVKQVGVLKIYSFLPKTNCKRCGESTCMAFAGRLSKYDAEIDECPVLGEAEYLENKKRLSEQFLDEM